MKDPSKPVPKMGTLEWREWLDNEIQQTIEEIRLLEQEKAKLEKELGIWPYKTEEGQ